MPRTDDERRPARAEPTTTPPAWPNSGGHFDTAGKAAVRDQLDAKQGEPGFWDNQDRAKSTIHQLKQLNSILKPYED